MKTYHTTGEARRALDTSKIKSPKELERIARRDLEGKTLSEIADWIHLSDATSRVQSKGAVGYVIERGYFGIKSNSDKRPDIVHLGVEVKTSPLRLGKDGKLRVKEPLSLNIINYNEEYKKKSLKQSSLFKKNRRVLFVWYVHDKNKKRSAYTIKYVFLWEMDGKVLSGLEPDYQAILSKIKAGKAHHIHQSDHVALTLCPKHNGDFKNPKERTSKTTQPFSRAPAEVRAFRLKNSYMGKVIRAELATRGPETLQEFIREKSKKTTRKKKK